jgi:putative flippase GtrA
MGRRLNRFAGEVAKFLAVGGLATVVALVIFNGLVHGYFGGPGVLNDQPLLAFIMANTVGMVVSYRGSRSWAFQHREVISKDGGRLAYFLINTASMIIPVGCLAFSRYVLDRADPVADNIAANVVGLALGTVARFFALRRFIFLHPLIAERRRNELSAATGAGVGRGSTRK